MSDAGPVEAAREAGLIYTSDSEPGIRRVRRGRIFTYVEADGRTVRDAATLARIKSLAVPPAWMEVWISPRPRGHLQATGRDHRGRKQFRYHPRWREVRDTDKYARLVGFAHSLPRLRSRVARDLRRPGLPREKVIATIVKLLETTLARVGNEEYARENGSFGLTTLRNRHVKVRGATVRFVFRGKSGVEHALGVTDRRVASVIKRCEELPGQMLFQYTDGSGGRGLVTSDDVNSYLRDVTGEDFTAKDFRTWAGTLLAACALRGLSGFESEAEAKRNVLTAIDSVARKLGHTRAVCRKAYVHPAVIETYLDGSLDGALDIEDAAGKGRLKPDEMALLGFLKRAARQRTRGDRPALKAA